MDKFDRIFTLHQYLCSRRTPASLKEIQTRLECSPATAKRTIAALRDQLGAPLVYDRERNGYFYDEKGKALYELPGLWFNDTELYALLVSHRLLTAIQPGLLEPQIRPLRRRIEALLEHRHLGHPELERRIRILQIASRPTDLDRFRMVATALLRRRRLHVLYHGRARDETTERDLSPQRLVYYRDNWYLDAWCHKRRALRSFSLDRLHPVYIDEEPAREVPEEKLEALLERSYGIFAGPPRHTAVLRFSPEAARWVADEQWHPKQQGRVLEDGGYELKVPYGDPTELVMDILKHGPEVEVIAPARLRQEVRRRLAGALARYDDEA